MSGCLSGDLSLKQIHTKALRKMGQIIAIEDIAQRIYFIRGFKVMLDRDLAELYEVETRILKRNVRRHIKRFPSDFMFDLSYQEFKSLISQFGMPTETSQDTCPWPSPNRVWRCFPAYSTAIEQLRSISKLGCQTGAPTCVWHRFTNRRNFIKSTIFRRK